MNTDPDCDCGACCTQCGHEPDCLTRLLDTDPTDNKGHDPDAYTL